MFDIGFPELLIVSVVALLVIGPDKLPETVRTCALWLGRLRRSLANIKQELEQEIGADEIRRQLHNEAIMKELNEAKSEVDGILNDANTSISEIKSASRIAPPGDAAATPNESREDDGRKQTSR